MGIWIKFLCLFALMAGARGLFYNWEVKQEMMGSYKEKVVTINRRHPGPTIQAHQGNRVFVRVTNRLSQNVAIHWHNTQQIQSLGSDGTGDVVPRPISPGKTFTYVFIVHQLGKSQYDSYYTMQTVAGLHGLINVLPPYGMAEPFAQDYHKSIILDDRYYKSYYDWATEPEFLLIPRTARNAINSEYLHWRVVLGKTYHLNISSVTTHCTLSFQIEGLNLTVVEVDGHYVEPFVNQSLIIYSERHCDNPSWSGCAQLLPTRWPDSEWRHTAVSSEPGEQSLPRAPNDVGNSTDADVADLKTARRIILLTLILHGTR